MDSFVSSLGNAKCCYSCSATHPFRSTKPNIRILGNVEREGCVALHYSVHFLRFLFPSGIICEIISNDVNVFVVLRNLSTLTRL